MASFEQQGHEIDANLRHVDTIDLGDGFGKRRVFEYLQDEAPRSHRQGRQSSSREDVPTGSRERRPMTTRALWGTAKVLIGGYMLGAGVVVAGETTVNAVLHRDISETMPGTLHDINPVNIGGVMLDSVGAVISPFGGEK